MNGYSISRDRSAARRNLGICMQQNVIWDDISIEDHLYVFARLRGLKGAALQEDVRNMMNHLGFPEKARSAAGTLSGGQKRRLCVGISMVGGNSVVYLDEPTVRESPHTACLKFVCSLALSLNMDHSEGRAGPCVSPPVVGAGPAEPQGSSDTLDHSLPRR